MKKVLKILTAWGVPVAYLNPPADGLHNVRVELNMNGPWILTGVLPRQNEKWSYFTDAYIFEIDGLHFRLVSTDEQRDEKNRLIANFRAEGLWAVELDAQYGPTRSVEVLSATARDAMAAVLNGTGWSIGTVTVPGIHDLETEKDSVIQNIQNIRELWGGDLDFDTTNRLVHLYAEGDFGADTGMQFRYRKNNRQIKRSVKWLPINRLYVYGKDDLTITSVNGDLEYLEDFSYTRQSLGLSPEDPIPLTATREGKVINQDIDDPAELLAWGQKQFQDLVLPKASYAVSVADLRTLTGHEHETFGRGDWATAIDEELGINVKARIVRHVYDPFGGYYPGVAPLAEVTLANFEDDLPKLLADLTRTAQAVKESILKNRILRRIAIDGLINTAAVEILSGETQLSWGAGGITAQEVDAQGNLTGRLLRITGQGIVISEDGGQNWSLAINGAGIIASEIIGQLIAGLNLTITNEAGNFLVDQNGVQVQDLTLTVNRSDGKSKIIISPTDGIKIQKQGTDKLYADANGNLVAEDLTANRLIMKSGNDVLIDGNAKTIDLSKFLTILGEVTVNNVPLYELIQSMNSDHQGQLSGNVIDSLVASKISAGTISAAISLVAAAITSNSSINITTDARVGHNLIFSAINYSGINWGTDVNKPTIYVDSAGGAMSLFCPGGVYASSGSGSQRLDQPPVAVFG